MHPWPPESQPQPQPAPSSSHIRGSSRPRRIRRGLLERKLCCHVQARATSGSLDWSTSRPDHRYVYVRFVDLLPRPEVRPCSAGCCSSRRADCDGTPGRRGTSNRGECQLPDLPDVDGPPADAVPVTHQLRLAADQSRQCEARVTARHTGEYPLETDPGQRTHRYIHGAAASRWLAGGNTRSHFVWSRRVRDLQRARTSRG